MSGSGTKDDPWALKTPPGSGDYTMWRDDTADPPQIVCQVGSTKPLYDARVIGRRRPSRDGQATSRRRRTGMVRLVLVS